MAFVFMCIYSFSFCVIFCLSLIFNRKCLLAKNSRKHYKFLPPRIEVDLVIKGDGHWGTTDEFKIIPFHLILFSAALVELTKSILVHSLILSSHLLCLPLLFPLTIPCRIIFAKREDLETWPNHHSFHFFTRVKSLSYSLMAAWIFLQTSLLVTWSLYEMLNSLW